MSQNLSLNQIRMRPFGWVLPEIIDLRDFSVEDYLSRFQKFMGTLTTLVRREVVWDCDTVLDQGDTPHCVGYTGADFQNTLPTDSNMSAFGAEDLYRQCKIIDGQPGMENGSSIHSLMKVLRRYGRINAYAFTSSLTTVKLWILTKGAVLVGTNWFEGMGETDPQGFVHPTGKVVGGHAYSLIGYDPKTDTFTGLNHWGATWGLNGRFRITGREFSRLLVRGCELAMAVELAQ